ncbi:hypothetical protein [Helicobacter sp.]|nr:hypothetical protein [Helicobacter sp.]
MPLALLDVTCGIAAIYTTRFHCKSLFYKKEKFRILKFAILQKAC